MIVLPTLPIEISEPRLQNFCQRWAIDELALFGSVLREDFRPDSDVDVLVSFNPKAQVGLLSLVRMERELSQLMGRKVDLVDKRDVEASPNWIRRREILTTAQPVYAAR